MPHIVVIAVIGVMLLQASGAVPRSSVGGPMMIALAFFGGALAVGIHEAWTKKRGALGWIVNIVVSLVGAFFAAQVGGMVMVVIFIVVSQFVHMNSSVAATGGTMLYFSLALGMVVTLLGTWGALWVVNRWRDA